MFYSSHEWAFWPNFNFGYGVLTADNGNLPPPLPPVSGDLILLSSGNFNLLDGTQFLLL